MSDKPTLVRITTVPISLEKLLSGQLRFMADHFHVIGVSSDDAGLQRVRKQEGIEVHTVPMTRKITPFQDLKTLWNLYWYLRKIKPEIVHSHTPKAGTVGMFAAKLAGVRHRLHTVAGLPLLEKTGKTRTLLNLVEKFTYACATKVYPNSFGLRDIILENKFCKANKLAVLANGSSNGIDTSHFSRKHFSEADSKKLMDELDLTDDDFVFVFVGRLVGDKGINELMSAFVKIHAEFPNVKLLLVGDYESQLDPLKPETLSVIESHPAVRTTGFRQDVRPYFAISDALVFPTYREGFPNVVLQAGAMELPCIVTDINGCNEIISHEKNGLIIPVKDEMAIFNTMKEMLENAALFQKMTGCARDEIVSRFEQRVVWQAILAEYQKRN